MALGPSDNGFDLQAQGDALLDSDGLLSAVFISLFTDARAQADDVLPDPGGTDRRGWCCDILAEMGGDRIGSRLWLLRRAKRTEATRLRAIEYAREALQWLIDDGVLRAVEIEAEWQMDDQLALQIVLHLLSGAMVPLDPVVVQRDL